MHNFVNRSNSRVLEASEVIQLTVTTSARKWTLPLRSFNRLLGSSTRHHFFGIPKSERRPKANDLFRVLRSIPCVLQRMTQCRVRTSLLRLAECPWALNCTRSHQNRRCRLLLLEYQGSYD